MQIFRSREGREIWSRGPVCPVKKAAIPDYYETIDINDIRSEAGAINVMGISGILDDFLGGENFKQTVSGRMASGKFTFQVNPVRAGAKAPETYGINGYQIAVNNSQVEIDGGFEDRDTFAMIEGKNVVHSNFLIRQLYYPYRLWNGKLAKPVRPVFMVYSNNIFRLLEYEFTDSSCYNSIRLVKEGLYSLEDTDISMQDLREAWERTAVKPEPPVVFIQADSFYKVISLVERLNENPMTGGAIAQLFGFKERQSDYYFNACRYLGLAEKQTDEDGVKVHITAIGRRLLKLPYRARQLEYVRLILEHPIFHDLFEAALQIGDVPDKEYVAKKMREYQVCGENLIVRRSSSVRAWLYWILTLVNEG